MAKQQLGLPETNPLDLATKQYVDSKASSGSGGGAGVVDNGDGTITITPNSGSTGGTGTGTSNLVVGQTNTLTTATPGLWIQTDALGNIITFWVENGLAAS